MGDHGYTFDFLEVDILYPCYALKVLAHVEALTIQTV